MTINLPEIPPHLIHALDQNRSGARNLVDHAATVIASLGEDRAALTMALAMYPDMYRSSTLAALLLVDAVKRQAEIKALRIEVAELDRQLAEVSSVHCYCCSVGSTDESHRREWDATDAL